MRSRTDNTKQVVVYVVMRDQQANVLFAHRVYFSERRAKNYCKRMNTAEGLTGYYLFFIHISEPPEPGRGSMASSC